MPDCIVFFKVLFLPITSTFNQITASEINLNNDKTLYLINIKPNNTDAKDYPVTISIDVKNVDNPDALTNDISKSFSDATWSQCVKTNDIMNYINNNINGKKFFTEKKSAIKITSTDPWNKSLFKFNDLKLTDIIYNSNLNNIKSDPPTFTIKNIKLYEINNPTNIIDIPVIKFAVTTETTQLKFLLADDFIKNNNIGLLFQKSDFVNSWNECLNIVWYFKNDGAQRIIHFDSLSVNDVTETTDSFQIKYDPSLDIHKNHIIIVTVKKDLDPYEYKGSNEIINAIIMKAFDDSNYTFKTPLPNTNKDDFYRLLKKYLNNGQEEFSDIFNNLFRLKMVSENSIGGSYSSYWYVNIFTPLKNDSNIAVKIPVTYTNNQVYNEINDQFESFGFYRVDNNNSTNLWLIIECVLITAASCLSMVGLYFFIKKNKHKIRKKH